MNTPTDKPVDAEVVEPTTALAITPTPAPEQENKQLITAAQAKVEAIADLTHSAYAKAGTLSLTKEESEALTADFPDEAFKPGADGKENLIYIEHAFLRDRLTKVFGMGQWALIQRRNWSEKFTLPPNYNRKEPTEGERVYVEAMLVIRGCFVAEAIGDMAYYPKNNAQNYGDAVEGAKTAALRRCCKEFGVGLQAWKKDWCQGWLDRKMAPGRRLVPRPPQDTPKTPPAAPTPKPAPLLPTPESRQKMLERLKARPEEPNRQAVEEYFFKVGQLLPTESLEKLELRFVPATTKQMEALASCIANFEAGGEAVMAFEPHTGPLEPEAKKAHDDEWWREIIVPIPRKGQKRDEYLKNPDTIGSLYDVRHEDEDARKRLWGFVEHYKPEAREFKGKVYQPTAADHKFREALDAFGDYFKKQHPDENL
jgi:hypothetical protein